MTASHGGRWTIVGGGMLGLSLALKLAQQGRRVVVLEAADRLGGLADAWRLGDIEWDRHYHVILPSDSHTRAMLTEIGLGDELEFVQTKTGFLVDGRFHSMSSSWEFLKFPPLTLWQKFRLAATIIGASRISDGKPLERIPVETWLRSWSGDRVVDRIWLPLLRAKLGENYKRTSAMFIWATIKRMYAARKSGAKKEVFGYVRGGYARILAAFEKKLLAAGVEIVTSAAVSSINRGAEGAWSIETRDGRRFSSENVVSTAPAPVTAKLCPDLPDDERRRLAEVDYQGIVCASVLLKKPLGPYYVVNITDPAPFTAVIEMTALVDPARFGGRSLVYLPWYLPSDHPGYADDDATLRDRYLAALEKIYPTFHRDDVLAFQVSRVRHVMAVPTLGYSERAPQTVSAAPGFFVATAAQIVDGTLNVNETLRLGAESLPRMLAHEVAPNEPLSPQETATREPAAR